jgi:hypothetical protein
MGSTALPGSFCHSQGQHDQPCVSGRVLANLLQSFLEAEDDFCKLDYTKEDLSDLTIKLDRSKILTSGRKGMFCVLCALRVDIC